MSNRNRNDRRNSYQQMTDDFKQWNSIDTDIGAIVAWSLVIAVCVGLLLVMGPLALPLLIIFALIFWGAS